MSRTFYVTLCLVAGLVLLLVAGGVIEHGRGKRQLAATIAELKADQRLPAPEELFASPGASNGIYIFTAAASRLDSPPSPPSMHVIKPGRALASFERTAWETYPKGAHTWGDLAQWDRDKAHDLQELIRALAFPECRPQRNWRDGFEMLLPELAKYKGGARALSSSALAAAHRNDQPTVLTHLTAARRLEQFLAQDPILISQLVRIASAATTLPCVWDIAHRSDWSEADLADLQAALPSDNYSLALAESLHGETILWMESIQRLTSQQFVEMTSPFEPDDSLELPSVVEHLAPVADELVAELRRGFRQFVLFPVWKFAWRDQALAFHLRVMDELFRRSRDAGQAQSLKEYSDADLLGPEPMGSYDRLRFSLTAATVPSLQRCLVKALRLETERALVETTIALRRFSLRNGRFPDRLDELVPNFLTALPIDRMDGQPLRYRRHPEGEDYTLWSIGEDLEDHGGDPTPTRAYATTLRWWNGKDAVMPRPASEAEVIAWAEEQAEKAKRKGTSSAGGGIPVDLLRRYGLMPAPGSQPAPPPPGP